MANYSLQKQAESGNWALPQSDEVTHCSSVADLRWHLEDWAETVGYFDFTGRFTGGYRYGATFDASACYF